jgi:hypothetical protein
MRRLDVRRADAPFDHEPWRIRLATLLRPRTAALRGRSARAAARLRRGFGGQPGGSWVQAHALVPAALGDSWIGGLARFLNLHGLVGGRFRAGLELRRAAPAGWPSPKRVDDKP